MTETERDAFKAGFLRACHSQGMTLDQTIEAAKGFAKQAMEKAALFNSPTDAVKDLADAAKSGVGLLRNSLGLAKDIAIPALGAGLGLSYLGGYMAPHVLDISDDERKEVQIDDLIDEYDHQAQVARYNAAAAAYRKQLAGGRRL